MSELPEAVEAWRRAGRLRSIAGREVFTVEMGDAEAARTILILHGFPASSFDWRAVMPLLAAHARVIAFDFLGYGLSDKPFEPRPTLYDQADLAVAVADFFRVRRATLVAHDMGDTVCAELLKRSVEGVLPFEVDGAVLTNGSIFIDLAVLSPGQEALLSLPDEVLPEPLPLEAFIPALKATFSQEHPPSDEEIEAALALIAHKDGDRLLPRSIRYIEERRRDQQRWTEGLVDFPGRLTAVWGEQDPIAVPDMVRQLQALRPVTEIVTWPDVAHWPSIEVPERLAAAIVERLPG